MLTATCLNCGAPKQPSEYANNWCDVCAKVKSDAEKVFATENPTANEAAVIYEGRRALMARAHSAHKNFVDPRDYGASRGMIPVPPQGGDRGSVPRG